MTFLLAIRAIDLAIMGTLGALWIGGASFIYVLYRWIIRYERAQGGNQPPGLATSDAADTKPTPSCSPAATDRAHGTPAGSDAALPVHA